MAGYGKRRTTKVNWPEAEVQPSGGAETGQIFSPKGKLSLECIQKCSFSPPSVFSAGEKKGNQQWRFVSSWQLAISSPPCFFSYFLGGGGERSFINRMWRVSWTYGFVRESFFFRGNGKSIFLKRKSYDTSKSGKSTDHNTKIKYAYRWRSG